MTTNGNKRKEANLLLLKKENNFNTSIQELNKISLNFHLNTFHKKNNSNTARLYNNYNNITKNNNYQNKHIENSSINTNIKTSSPTKDNISNREIPNELQNKKIFHHKKINSNLFINNQILNELFPTNITSNSNKAKDSIYNSKQKKGSKNIKKKHIQIDTYNINNKVNIKNTSKKITNQLKSNNNPHHKINLKIYLEKHQRVLSTDSNNTYNKSIKVNSKKKKYEKENKSNINSVIKNKRLITNKNSTRLLNNYNLTSNTLSRANSSWINKENNIFNTSGLEQNLSKKITKKNSIKNKINNVIVTNINNYKKDKKFKIAHNIELRNNDLLNLNNLKEKTTLYYLTNISEEFKTKQKKFNNGNNIFISINNYANDNKKILDKNNVNLTEGKDIQNYISKKSTRQKENLKIRRRNYLKKNDNKYKILGESKNYSQNKTGENFYSYNSEIDKIEGPELTHFFIVASIQKGIQNIQNCN